MKLKFKDLELALDYIKANAQIEIVTVEEGSNGISLELGFDDKNNKATKITLYSSPTNTTPEVRVTNKLYRNSIGLKEEKANE